VVVGTAQWVIGLPLSISVGYEVKVKSVYFIVRPKVDQRAGLLSLPHLEIFAIHTRYFFKFKLLYIAP